MTRPADDMRAFEPIIGRWETSGTVFDEQGSIVQRIAGTDEYEWMDVRLDPVGS